LEDLSLHILDIVENSIDAGSDSISIKIDEDTNTDRLTIEIDDNGKGMDAETIKKALDPFYTSKTVRRVGLGLPMFRQAALAAGGEFDIRSVPGRGTQVRAVFQHSHIDRMPLGDVSKTLLTLLMGHPEVQFSYTFRRDDCEWRFDTEEFASGDSLSTMDTLQRIRVFRQHWPKMS